MEFPVNDGWFLKIAKLGCGPLHDYMLVMVHFLNASVSKKIFVKEQERQELFTKEKKKEEQKSAKENYQNEFCERLQLKINYVNPKGGTTNVGRTAHFFFNNPQITSEILGFPRQLISLTGLLLRDLNQVHSFPDIDR
jgi:hypothetical protein